MKAIVLIISLLVIGCTQKKQPKKYRLVYVQWECVIVLPDTTIKEKINYSYTEEIK